MTQPAGKVLMLLSNAFDPDPRVQREAMVLINQGYKVDILCWDRDIKAKEFEVADGIQLHRVYVKSTHGRGAAQILFLLFFWFKALFKGLGHHFDVVHAHDFDTLPLGYILARLKNARLVYDSHESYVDMIHSHPWWLKKAIVSVENILLKKVDLLITVGEKLRRFFELRGAKNTCVVGNWQDPDKFKYSSDTLASVKKELGIHTGQMVISFIANLGLERQVPQLIEAVKQCPQMFLIIGGNGPCRQMARDAAASCSNIHYLGYVHPEKVPLYTACADIIFYGFDPYNPNARFSAPNKLFEGLAAGKIILTADFGEIGRIVKETRSGIILENYSARCLQAAFTTLATSDHKTFRENSIHAGKTRYNLAKAGTILSRQYHLLLSK